jgi:hypothetical protein
MTNLRLVSPFITAGLSVKLRDIEDEELLQEWKIYFLDFAMLFHLEEET